MKTRIFKIIITLAISLFLSAGISLAHDKKGRQHKSNGKAYGYHSDQNWDGHHPGWQKKKRKLYRHKDRQHNYYQRYYYHKDWRGPHPKWKKWHYKSRHRSHEHKRHYPRRLEKWKLHDRDRDWFILGMSFDDPYMSLVFGAKGN